MTSQRSFVVPEVLEVQDVALSDEVRIVPLSPTARKVLFTCLTAHRIFDVPEVLDVQMVPSMDVSMVPESPTAKNFTEFFETPCFFRYFN